MAANGENKGEGEEEKEDEEKDEEEEEEEEGVQDENGDGSSSSKAAEGKERMEESGSNGDEDISGVYHIIPSRPWLTSYLGMEPSSAFILYLTCLLLVQKLANTK